MEAISSSSLFELEAAYVKESKKDDKNSQGEEEKINSKRQDTNKRWGKVYSYSKKNSIESGQPGAKSEEIMYRLRHLNTGRLVIDQEIVYNGIKIRTLGLAPHLIIEDLSKFSEKSIEAAQQDLEDQDHPSKFKIKDPGVALSTYAEIDRRSRFRIISTSPSLDTRIKINSCLQIQHVATEMFLSYETTTQF